jgi:hypothetical protein
MSITGSIFNFSRLFDLFSGKAKQEYRDLGLYEARPRIELYIQDFSDEDYFSQITSKDGEHGVRVIHTPSYFMPQIEIGAWKPLCETSRKGTSEREFEIVPMKPNYSMMGQSFLHDYLLHDLSSSFITTEHFNLINNMGYHDFGSSEHLSR